jgi:hypothetical protein
MWHILNGFKSLHVFPPVENACNGNGCRINKERRNPASDMPMSDVREGVAF